MPLTRSLVCNSRTLIYENSCTTYVRPCCTTSNYSITNDLCDFYWIIQSYLKFLENLSIYHHITYEHNYSFRNPFIYIFSIYILITFAFVGWMIEFEIRPNNKSVFNADHFMYFSARIKAKRMIERANIFMTLSAKTLLAAYSAPFRCTIPCYMCS